MFVLYIGSLLSFEIIDLLPPCPVYRKMTVIKLSLYTFIFEFFSRFIGNLHELLHLLLGIFT